MTNQSITLLELNNRIARLVTQSVDTRDVWITAELSDVSTRRGHCYMELLQKDDNGVQLAKARGVIWANTFNVLSHKFTEATGQPFATGIKLMLRVSVSMHPVFGMSLVINDLDPNYTMGDLLRRRREIIERLTREGVIDMNRSLEWPPFVQRIAVISAPGAAGYGDFINQLMRNPSHLRFEPRLFQAVMQGEQAARSIIAALGEIAGGEWDCVVIIRGGGATSDLQCFEDYELALNIAQFEIPVIIGIGHERDITLLDSVANMRVKTPTAAAEWLITLGEQALATLDSAAQTIYNRVGELISGSKEQLSYYQGLLPILPLDAIRRASLRLSKAGVMLSGISAKRLAPARSRLDVMAANVSAAAATAIARALQSLDNSEKLLEALSPDAILKRGFSITRVNGHTVTDASMVHPGDTLSTILASGTLTSRVE